MSDEILIEGKQYVLSRRAAEITGYAQDYIGQLARKANIDARRVGGLWYVSMPSLESYKTNADAYKPTPPSQNTQHADPDSLISFDGRDHVSATKAAKITGYHQDYVGQLARSGAIMSRQIGNRWYVDREAIVAHKKQKDSLLAAVQADSVGIKREDASQSNVAPVDAPYSPTSPLLTYTHDDRELIPTLSVAEDTPARKMDSEPSTTQEDSFERNIVPINVSHRVEKLHHRSGVKPVKYGSVVHEKTTKQGLFGGFVKLSVATLTVVIVLSLGFAAFEKSEVFGNNILPANSIAKKDAYAAGVVTGISSAFARIRVFAEDVIARDLFYERSE